MPGQQSNRICPETSPARDGLMIVVFSVGFCMLSRLAAGGRIARRNMGLQRQSIIGSIAGRGGEYGRTFSRPLSTRRCWCIPHRLIPAMSKPTVLPMVEKGGEKSGYRALTRRPDNENPRINRPFGASCGVNPNAGQYQRHHCCRRFDQGCGPCSAADCRQGI